MKNNYEIREDHVVIFLKHKGKIIEALIDIEDFPRVSDYPCTWHALNKGNTYYVRGHIPGTNNTQKIYLHHLLLNPPKGYMIDHINHNGLDNRRSNIRILTARENRQNSIAKGIDKNGKKYRARVQVNGKRIIIGRFDTPEEAQEAVRLARARLSPLSMEAATGYKPKWVDIKVRIPMEQYKILAKAAGVSKCSIEDLIKESIETKCQMIS